MKTKLANCFKGESPASLVKKFAKILDARTIQDVAGEIAKAIPGSAKEGTQRPHFIIRDLQEVEKVGRRLDCPIL